MTKLNPSELTLRIGEPFEETTLAKVLKRLPGVSPNGPWLAGGAVRKTLAGEKLDSDFDFFFANEEQFKETERLLRDQYGGILQAKNDKNSTYVIPSEQPYSDDSGDLVIRKDGTAVILPEIKVQLINFQYFSSLEDVLDAFDFTICQFGYDGEDIIAGDFALWDLARKRLVPHKISFAVSSMRRMMKYAKQGYTVCNGAMATILEQVVNDPQIIHEEIKYID